MFERLGDADVCYITTNGRTTGRPHEIEIWFAIRKGTLYLLSGGASAPIGSRTSSSGRG
jgi:hypothetical protein